eukprot:NODE_38_length_35257_cov_0.939047.p30 type:complete len:112 gc:universal NODE_38_length_35257_cov_0.939047:22439-22104(-)
MSFFSKPASLSTRLTGLIVFLNNSMFNSSNLALVKVSVKSSPSINESISILTVCCDESARFAFSASRFNFPTALGSFLTSFLVFCFHNCPKYATILLSKSSPPKWVSPAVA